MTPSISFVNLRSAIRGGEPQAAGLGAISAGLPRIFSDDHEMLEYGMVMYDALYAWCKEGQDETLTWNLDAIRL